MPTRETETNGVGPAAKQVAEHASSLARLELELAVLELKKKVAALGIGIGLGVGALLFALFALGFGFATVAAALAAVALVLIRKGAPPVPEQAIAEARRTTEALKSDAGS